MNTVRRTCAITLSALTPLCATAQLEDPIPGPIPLGDVVVRLSVVCDGLTAPNWGTPAPGHDALLFVVDQPGQVWAIDLTTGAKTLFLDVSDRLVDLGIGGPGTFDERGLLGVAFHPQYATPGTPGFGKLYTYESHPFKGAKPDFTTQPKGVDPNHQTVIVEWQVKDPTDPKSTVDPDSDRTLLRIDQPQFNHDGGAVSFGHDGMLYIALGDGGGGDDQGTGHVDGGNGQDATNIHGNLLRIDPLGDNAANGQYGIPGDNPFVNSKNLDEIFAYGLRNPFRFSVDQDTGDIWLGDAGQNDIEEIDIIVSGGNYGWPVKEGTFLFDMNGNDPGFVIKDSPGEPKGMIDPVAQYDHDEGVVVIGGFVYRGDDVPALAGRYVFAEFASRLFTVVEGEPMEELAFTDALEHVVLGFGQDASGEVYVMGNTTGVPFDKTGVVLKIEAACAADCNGDGELTIEDFICFQEQWQAGTGFADCDGNGELNILDFVCFQTLFVGGCK